MIPFSVIFTKCVSFVYGTFIHIEPTVIVFYQRGVHIYNSIFEIEAHYINLVKHDFSVRDEK